MIPPHTFAVIRVQRVHLNEDYKLANAASNTKLFGAGDPNSFDVAHEDQTVCTVLVKSAGDIFRKIRMWHAIFDLRFLGVVWLFLADAAFDAETQLTPDIR